MDRNPPALLPHHNDEVHNPPELTNANRLPHPHSAPRVYLLGIDADFDLEPAVGPRFQEHERSNLSEGKALAEKLGCVGFSEVSVTYRPPFTRVGRAMVEVPFWEVAGKVVEGWEREGRRARVVLVVVVVVVVEGEGWWGWGTRIGGGIEDGCGSESGRGKAEEGVLGG